MSEMKPRSHRVAYAAYQRVEARMEFTQKKAYGALAHKLPVLILQHGLAHATGFLLAKSKDGKGEYQALLEDLADVLRETDEGGCENRQTFHKTVISSDTVRTMHLTRRSLEAAGWIKRYAQGLLKIDATGDEVKNA